MKLEAVGGKEKGSFRLNSYTKGKRGRFGYLNRPLILLCLLVSLLRAQKIERISDRSNLQTLISALALPPHFWASALFSPAKLLSLEAAKLFSEGVIPITKSSDHLHFKKIAKISAISLSKPRSTRLAKLFLKKSNRKQNTFVFAVYSDTRNGHEIHMKIVNRILELQPDFVIHIGDYVNSLFPDPPLADQWYKFKEIAQPLIEKSPPPGLPVYFFPALGNHDMGSREIYFDIFNKEPINHLYYSFTYRNAHFTVLYVPHPATGFPPDWDAGNLDFGISPSSRQYRWLKEDLRQASSDPQIKWKFVFFHAPVFSCVSGSPCAPPVHRYLLPLFEKYNVDIVFNSHAHSYQRFQPISRYEIRKEGITYIVTAGGGAPLYEVDNEDCNTAHGEGCDSPVPDQHKEVRYIKAEKRYHFLKIVVNESEVVGEAVSPEGEIFDRFVVAHGPACGDGFLDPGEECDDGNLLEGDGCNTQCQATGIRFIRGDVTGDGKVNLADAIGILNYLFSGVEFSCQDALDSNDDGRINLADAIFLLQYLFSAASKPPEPFPEPGPDPTGDSLGCESKKL